MKRIQIFIFITALTFIFSCQEQNLTPVTINKDITSNYLKNGNLEIYLGNSQIFRYKGKPGTVSIPVGLANLSDFENCFILHIANGITKATAVSSAIITLDGTDVLNTSDFSKNMGQFTFEICNLNTESALTVEVRGEPGSYIDIWIEGKLKDKNIVAYYPFNGNVNDESGNGYNGIKSGATLTPDRFGNANKAFYFDGISSKIDIPNSANMILTKNFTVSLWVKTPQFFENSYNGHGFFNGNAFFVKGQDRNPGSLGIIQQFAADETPCTKITFWVRFNEQVPQQIVRTSYVISNTIPQPNVWYNVVGTSDENEIKIYVNGILENTTNTTGFTYSPSIDNAAIGYNPYIGDPFQYFHLGTLDDIKIYSRTLTATEILAKYHEGAY